MNTKKYTQSQFGKSTSASDNSYMKVCSTNVEAIVDLQNKLTSWYHIASNFFFQNEEIIYDLR